MKKTAFFPYFASLLVATGSLLANQDLTSWEQEQIISSNDWQNTWSAPNVTDFYYQIINFETSQNLVQLHDGSQWKISPSDTAFMAGWTQGHPIVIEIDYSWYYATSSGMQYIYTLVNLSNNSKARALLFAGPTLDNPLLRGQSPNPYLREVNAILRQSRQISLNDGSTWVMTPEDDYLMEKWDARDGVILGRVRKGWLNWSYYDNILINVDANHYVRVKKI